MKAVNWSYRYRSLLLNLLFGGYLLFLQPGLLQRLEATRGYSVPDPLIGIILIMFPLIELVGLYLKRPVFAYHFAKRFPDDRALYQNSRLQLWTRVFSFFSSLSGMALTAVFTFAALSMLGIGRAALLCIPVFPVIILKGGSIALLWYGASSGEIGMNAPRRISTPLALRDLGGDVLLLLYSAIGYTTLWEANPFFLNLLGEAFSSSRSFREPLGAMRFLRYCTSCLFISWYAVSTCSRTLFWKKAVP